MNVALIVLLIMIFLVVFVLKFLSSGQGAVQEELGDPVKFDFMLFNSDGLKCKDGQVLNCNIIVKGFSHENFSRQLIHEEYVKALQKMALEKDPDWFFSERLKSQELFRDEFIKMYCSITFNSLEIAELAYADECFTDREIVDECRKREKEEVKKEVDLKIADLEREREEQVQQLEEERERALKKATEETAAAMARVEEENRQYLAEAEEAYQEALKQEEELKKKKY